MPELTIRATMTTDGRLALNVGLHRPEVVRLFRGQMPEVVVKQVPLLYNLCCQAQQAAASAAFAAAKSACPISSRHDDSLLWTELLHESLWRLLLDWPPALGLPAAKEAFIGWRKQRFTSNVVAATQRLLRDELQLLVQQCAERLGGDGSPEPAGLAPFAALAPFAWLAYVNGQTAEQPVPPMPGSVRSVYLARVVQLKQAALALSAGVPYPITTAGDGCWGVGQTQTARGVLTHAVRLAAGVVTDYRIWAPTDHFFADANALKRLLAGQTFDSPDAARQALHLALLALDPCVPYALELTHA